MMLWIAGNGRIHRMAGMWAITGLGRQVCQTMWEGWRAVVPSLETVTGEITRALHCCPSSASVVSTDRSRPGSNMDPPLTFVSPHPVQQNSYELQLETRSWLDAQSFCRLNHADLANVTSPAEGEKVKALLQRDGVEQAWFGLHRDSWVWTDGSATSYTSWLAGQPNNAGGSQGCVYMEKEKWNDFPCTNQYYVLCQKLFPRRKRFVLKLELSSDINPNLPSVREFLLQQLLSWLSDSGLTDVKVS
uniref:C-type lectin domain-containing protein n=1 Tax=Oryzias latipes TaxID=8090 RepID=A0A3P9IK66_ORYLA